MRSSPALRAALALALALSARPLLAEDTPPAGPVQAVTMSPADLFRFADAARDAGDHATAAAAYRALAQNTDLEIRSEARFRLGMMLADKEQKYREAAIEFRRILDDKPEAPRVRIELARMHAQLGNVRAAERELRAAEAAGLPSEVERVVRFYANVLNSRKRFGGSIEVALAPDTNFNRATRSDTLGTVIGDFTLDENAKAKSGIGLGVRGQTYYRQPAGTNTDMLLRASGNANVYAASRFNDLSANLRVGPEFRSGKDRLVLSAGPGWRWFGQKLYTVTLGGNASWQHPLTPHSQVRLEGAVSRVDNRINDLQDAWNYTLSSTYDHAFSGKLGAGVQLYGFRESASDPGYSTTTGGLGAYAYREMGRATLIATAGYARLEADRRLALYPRRRMEDRFSASLAATLRAIRVGAFSPMARIQWERNSSSIEIYDYRRLSAEFGVTSAF
jgi:hypothetical protein